MKLLLKIVSIILLPFIIGKTIPSDDGSLIEPDYEYTEAYPEHIAGAYTGGFGEQSCHSCHFDYELNQPEGELSVSGIENSFEPGEKYQINIKLKREDMAEGGFQMTARFEDSTQAGTFDLNENLTRTPNIDSDVSYVQHGVGKTEAQVGEITWQVTWVAPNQTKPVFFNIAANATNGDASEFGDWIYVKEVKIQPIQ